MQLKILAVLQLKFSCNKNLLGLCIRLKYSWFSAVKLFSSNILQLEYSYITAETQISKIKILQLDFSCIAAEIEFFQIYFTAEI